MAEPRARLGDVSSHGGRIITCATTVFVDGIPVARLLDLHACPMKGHGITPIVSGSTTVSAEGLPVALIGSVCGCGAQIVSGSAVVSAG